MKSKLKLNLSGKEFEFYLGLNFVAHIYETLGLTITELEESIRHNMFVMLPKVMHESYLLACKRNDEKIVLDDFEFFELLQENGGILTGSKAQDFFAEFMVSLGSNLTLPSQEQTEEDSKKK